MASRDESYSVTFTFDQLGAAELALAEQVQRDSAWIAQLPETAIESRRRWEREIEVAESVLRAIGRWRPNDD